MAAAHLVMNSVPMTNAPNMLIAVQLVACLSAWPRSAPAAHTATDTPHSAASVSAWRIKSDMRFI